MGLDDSQKVAVELPVIESAFVNAPPGYGKTYVITERIKYLISSGNVKPPQKILALTFSNSAANEMRKRIQKELFNSEKYIDIMNFHTFAYHLLKIYGNYVGINRNFTIINESREYEFKKSYFKNIGLLNDPYDDYKLIQKYDEWYSKNFLANEPFELENIHFDDLKDKIDNEMITEEELNFNHMLHKSLKLLKNHSSIKNSFYNKYKFILADEFQDTNYIQYQLFKEISTNTNGERRTVFVVGDIKQAIMRFQGANPKNIIRVSSDFDCREICLEENHRVSSKKIELITARLRGFTDESSDQKFEFFIARTGKTVEKINNRIVNLLLEQKQKNQAFHDICILSSQEKTQNKLKRSLKLNDINYVSLTEYNFKNINKKYFKLFKCIESLINQKYNKNSVQKIVNTLIVKFYPENQGNLILSTIKNFSKRFDNIKYSSLEIWKRLQEFYNHLQIDIDWSKLLISAVRDKIFLSTIHSAKGLEFKYIIFLGVVNYRIPHSSVCVNLCGHGRNYKDNIISEDKDLFYVGVSRAMEDIFFFYSRQDEETNKPRKLSCVLNEITDLMVFIDLDIDEEYDVSTNLVRNLFCKKNNI